MQAGPTARTRVRGARKYIVTAGVVAFSEQRREQKEARVNEWPGVRWLTCACVQLAPGAGGLFHCLAEFIMQPVARMCLFPCERNTDEVFRCLEPCFCLCDIGRIRQLVLW